MSAECTPSDLQPSLTQLRRQLHAAPELSGCEQHTAATLLAELQACAPDRLLTGVGGHGLIALFDSGRPGPTVLLRADIDALPITESGSQAHCSRHPGVAHLCGHDGHSAALIGVAKLLSAARPARGQVALLFQPAEETGSGARAVLDDPAFATIRPDRVFAFHNLPGYPLGQVVVRAGSFTAAVQSLVIELEGCPAHAAEPEHGRNPAQAIAELLQLAQALSCNHPERPDFALVTPVYAHLGERAYGTAAGEGEVHFTLRSWTQQTMSELESRLLSQLAATCERDGLQARHRWIEAFAACDNQADAVALISKAAAEEGMSCVTRPMPFKWGEDFGLFTQRFPGALFGIGAGETQPALHNSDYDFPDAILLPAAQLLYRLARSVTDTPNQTMG